MLAEFLVDGPHLLAQVVVPLALGNLVLDFRLDLGLHGRELQFVREHVVDPLEPSHGLQDFEQLLGFFDLQPQVGRHEVGQLSGVVDVLQDGGDVDAELAAQGQNFLGLLADVAHQRFDLEGDLLDRAAPAAGRPAPGTGARLRTNREMLPLATPCTRTLTRPSGSFSMRSTRPTVPVR